MGKVDFGNRIQHTNWSERILCRINGNRGRLCEDTSQPGDLEVQDECQAVLPGEVVPKQILKDGAVGGNHRKISRKEDSEQKGLHIQSGRKETAEHVQGRTRSWVLLKHEERQEWDEKIREVISTQAPEAVICSPPFLASLPSLGSFPFFPSHCNSHSPAQPALASTVSLTPSCCPWDLPADLRLFPLQAHCAKGSLTGALAFALQRGPTSSLQ